MAVSAVNVKAVFTASIGRKIVMAITGLFLCTFLIAHLSGNLLLLKNDGGIAFNEYSEFMVHSPLIRVAEFILLFGILFHIVFGIQLILKNNKSRPVGYKVSKAGQNSTFYSRFMSYSGIAVLLFIIIHLTHFFWPHRVLGEEASMYDTAVALFKQPAYSIFYLVSFVLLSFHLAHGVQSGFQSLGLQVSPKMQRRFKAIGWGFAILICAGFSTIPIYFLGFQ